MGGALLWSLTYRRYSRSPGLPAHQSYTARDESQLKKVFADLPKHILVSRHRHEVSADFAALGALFALAAFGAATRWSPRPS